MEPTKRDLEDHKAYMEQWLQRFEALQRKPKNENPIKGFLLTFTKKTVIHYLMQLLH